MGIALLPQAELVIAAADPAVQRVRVVAAHPDRHVAAGAVRGQVELVLPSPGHLAEVARGGAGGGAGGCEAWCSSPGAR